MMHLNLRYYDNLDTLQAAIAIATKEQNLRVRVNLSNIFTLHPGLKEGKHLWKLIIVDNLNVLNARK